MRLAALALSLSGLTGAGRVHAQRAQTPPAPAPVVYTIGGRPAPGGCESCAEWSVPHAPVRVHGTSWYVGTRDLASILIMTPAGHVLIDAGLEATVPQLLANIKAVGANVRDIRWVLNSHVHYDHAQGTAAVVAASGARVAALPWSARALEAGVMPADDPQFGMAFDNPRVRAVRVLQDGDTLRVGGLVLRAHATPGHTPGSTTWTWQSCEGGRCVDVVYADSQTPISADGFRFTAQRGLAEAVERGHRTLETLPCRLLITPHPGASRFWERVAQGTRAGADSLLDVTGCARYAGRARAAYQARYAKERAGSPLR
ncbi:MAG: subclass B3 metallo-beta-lactamase [Gemmatimonadetes bacterium]|nr:subclass B3 metallo-beta-lactamase [Gemmatimonadota bacterium]